MSDGDLTTELAAIKKRSEQPLYPDFGALSITNTAVRALLESAGDVPRLVAAVEAAWSLAANAQVVRAAITRELTGKDGTDEK